MTDTLDWLETIGSDATLRHLSPAQLKTWLLTTGASDDLLAAVAAGDGTPLRREFGIRHAPQAVQSNRPGFGDDDAAEAEEEPGGEDDASDGVVPPPTGPAAPPAKRLRTH